LHRRSPLGHDLAQLFALKSLPNLLQQALSGLKGGVRKSAHCFDFDSRRRSVQHPLKIRAEGEGQTAPEFGQGQPSYPPRCPLIGRGAVCIVVTPVAAGPGPVLHAQVVRPPALGVQEMLCCSIQLLHAGMGPLRVVIVIRVVPQRKSSEHSSNFLERGIAIDAKDGVEISHLPQE
jgi:hypothetical protein